MRSGSIFGLADVAHRLGGVQKFASKNRLYCEEFAKKPPEIASNCWTKKQSYRRGLSLLEVMLALAILGGALAVIGQLIRIGAHSAAVARDSATAQLLAESKMAEIASGIILPETQTQQPVDDTGEWLCSVEAQEIDQQGLLAVQVLVEQDPTITTQPVSFKLTRWIVDPAVEEAARAETAEIKKSVGANANQGQAGAAQPSAASAMGAGGAGAGAGGFGAGGNQGGGGRGGNGQGGQGGPGQGGNNGPGGGQNGPGGGQGGPGGGQGGPRGGGQGGPRGGGGGQGGPRGGGQGGFGGGQGGFGGGAQGGGGGGRGGFGGR